MKPGHILPAILLTACAATGAQVVPAATTGPGLAISGTLRYNLRYSETAQFYGGAQGDVQRSVASGDLTYSNANQARPFSLTYSGGDMWNSSGPSEGSGVFQHLSASQGILRRSWSATITDDVSYLPQAPTTGFSGIPGVGGLPSEPGPPPQQILTENTRSIYNKVIPSFTHRLDYATSASIGGSYGIERFPDGNGLETNQLQISPQITRRLNALNSIFCQYSFSRFSYPGYKIITELQSVPCGYQRAWNRHFRTSVSAGPQRIKTSGIAGTPPTTGLFLSASAGYQARSTSATLSYTQTTTGSGGALIAFGTRSHDVNAEFARQFGKNLTVSASGAYMRTQALTQISLIGLDLSGVTNGKYGGVAATRKLGRFFNVFANYTAIQQSSSAALPSNAISGLSQVIGFGIGWSPREMRFKK